MQSMCWNTEKKQVLETEVMSWSLLMSKTLQDCSINRNDRREKYA